MTGTTTGHGILSAPSSHDPRAMAHPALAGTPYRIETFDDGIARGGAICLPTTRDAHVLIVLRQDGDRLWTFARIAVESSAALAPWERLTDVPRRPAEAEDLADLGVTAHTDRLAERVFSVVYGNGFANFLNPFDDEAPQDLGHPLSLPGMTGVNHPGEPHPAWPGFAPDGWPRPAVYGQRLAILPHLVGRGERVPVPEEIGRKAIREAIDSWADAMRTLVLGPCRDLAWAWTWTWRLQSWLTDPVMGARRRQAAALHPALAPAMMADEATGEAIDAGAPFEPALAEAIASWPSMAGLPVAGKAAMRRLRGIPFTIQPADVSVLAAMAVSNPIDHLPGADDRDGWVWLAAWARAVHPLVTGNRLPEHGHWANELHAKVRAVRRRPDSVMQVRCRASDAEDMARSLAENLIEPMTEGGIGIGVARALLNRGVRCEEAFDAVERWHERQGGGTNVPRSASWPALFDPFVAGNGVTATCVTTQAGLTEEGGEAEEGGLSHCVGGYGRSCLRGETHVVSISKATAEPGKTRLSTLCLVPDPSSSGTRFVIQQHRGSRNGEPPSEAKAAVEELMRAIADGILETRTIVPRIEGVPAPVPADFDPERAYRLWAPFLPGGSGSIGLVAFRDLASALADGADPLSR